MRTVKLLIVTKVILYFHHHRLFVLGLNVKIPTKMLCQVFLKLTASLKQFCVNVWLCIHPGKKALVQGTDKRKKK